MPLTRRRPEDKSEWWRPKKSVRVYLDDIDALLAILHQVSGEVTADTGDFSGTITSANELRVVGQTSIDKLELKAERDDVQFDVWLKDPVMVRISPKDDIRLTGALQAVQGVMEKAHMPLGGSPLLASGVGGPLLIALWIGFLFAAYYIGIAYAGPIVLAILVASAFGTRLLAPNRQPGVIILLTYRSEAPTWWQRNRTAVLISLATNVLTGAAFFALGLWVGK